MADIGKTAREKARKMWEQGQPLGAIAEQLRCSIYDLSPWLYYDDLSKLRRTPVAEQAWDQEADRG